MIDRAQDIFGIQQKIRQLQLRNKYPFDLMDVHICTFKECPLKTKGQNYSVLGHDQSIRGVSRLFAGCGDIRNRSILFNLPNRKTANTTTAEMEALNNLLASARKNPGSVSHPLVINVSGNACYAELTSSHVFKNFTDLRWDSDCEPFVPKRLIEDICANFQSLYARRVDICLCSSQECPRPMEAEFRDFIDYNIKYGLKARLLEDKTVAQ